MEQTVAGPLDAAYAELVGAALASDADRYAAAFTEDGALLPPGEPAVRGRDGIREWIGRFLERYRIEVETLTTMAEEADGRVGFRWWTARRRYLATDGTPPVPFDQNYLDTLVKSSNGTWRFACHIVNSAARSPGIWDARSDDAGIRG